MSSAVSWREARHAAWRAFGQRYWRWIVGLELLGKVMPFLLGVAGVAGLFALGVWVWHHAGVPHLHLGGGWWWLPLLAAVVLLAGWRAWRWWNPAGRGRGVGRLVAAGLLAAGLLVVTIVWRS